jgi:hypothetical protein
MPQALTGKRKSMPKLVRVNAADWEAVIYRNLGDGRRLPFVWADTVTVVSGATTVVVASGVVVNDFKVAEAKFEITPLSAAAAAMAYYVDKNTTTNVVTLTISSPAGAALDFDVIGMLGISYDIVYSARRYQL